jgi:hypothetical protein
MEQEIEERAFIAAARKYRANKSKIDAALVRCIKIHANDPGSIQFVSAEVFSVYSESTTYSVLMRGRNAFGALVLGRNHVTLSRGYACESVDAPD